VFGLSVAIAGLTIGNTVWKSMGGAPAWTRFGLVVTVRERRSVRLGWTVSEIGGEGRSERPPWAGTDLGDVFPAKYVREPVERNLASLGLARSPRGRAPPRALA